MFFNSIDYFIFLPIVLIVFRLMPERVRWGWLLIASYFFYMYWRADYAVLIAASTVVDYTAARVIHRSERPLVRRLGLLVSLVFNLGLLFTFKYWNFFGTSLNEIFAWLDVNKQVPNLNVLLPVGISFYTFQTMAYTIDVYWRRVTPEKHFGIFALYVSYFPQLVAGPIERPGHLLPQLHQAHPFDWHKFHSGCQLILWGLFKKVVISDNVAMYVDAVYNNAGQHGAGSSLIATYAFAWQIYCDFSGYTDIARGTALLLGVDLMENFRQPYFATTITDFWRRWHISLSSWLRDYLYIPLGGNRKGPGRTQVNLLLTMLLGGLWHGASWNFVIWGGLQGVMLILSRQTIAWRDRMYAGLHVPDVVRDNIRRLITFHLVCLSWVFFRARTPEIAFQILRNVFAGDWSQWFFDPRVLVGGAMLPILLLVQLIQFNRGSAREYVGRYPTVVRWACWYGLIFLIVLLGVQGGSQFIYFQF